MTTDILQARLSHTVSLKTKTLNVLNTWLDRMSRHATARWGYRR